MADKMKYDFYVPVVRQVALNNMPLRNCPIVCPIIMCHSHFP